MVDPNEFMMMTRVREGDTDRPDDFVGAGAQQRKEKSSKKKWPSGDSSGASRVGEWLGDPGGGQPRRSWKVKDLSKSTLADLETAKSENSSSSQTPASSASSSTRRWKPPPKSDAALPPWMSSSASTLTTSSRPKWIPKKHNPPTPPVNRPSPVEAIPTNDSAAESNSTVGESKPRKSVILSLETGKRTENPQEDNHPGKDADESEDVAKCGKTIVEDAMESQNSDKNVASPSSDVDEAPLIDVTKDDDVSEVSSAHEVESDSDASRNCEMESQDGNTHDVKKGASTEGPATETCKADSESNSGEDDEIIMPRVAAALSIKQESDSDSADSSSKKSEKESDRGDGSKADERMPEDEDSVSERYEVESEVPAKIPANSKEHAKAEDTKYSIAEGPDPNEFKVMTMVREGETNRPDDFVCSGQIGKTRKKKDAPKKRWGSTTSAGGDRADDWLGAPGGGKPKRSWKVKG